MADTTMIPVGNTGKTQDPFGAINNILGIASKQQELQSQGIALQRQKNFSNFQNVFKPLKYTDPKTGILDTQAAYAGDEFKNAGNAQDAAQAYIQKIQEGQIKSKTDIQSLNNDALTSTYNGEYALANDPEVIHETDEGKRKVKDFYTQQAARFPTSAQLIQSFAGVAEGEHSKDKLADLLYHHATQGFDVATAREQFNPQPYEFPDGTKGFRDPRTGQVWKAHESAGPPGTAPPPGAAPPPRTGPPGAAGGSGTTGFFKPNGQPHSAADDRPGSMEPDPVHKAYWADAGDALKHVSDIRKADSEYGSNKTILSEIRNLSYDTSSGPGSPVWQSALGAIGAVTGTDLGGNYQKLGAWLDRLATQGQTDLPQTNAGLAASQRIVGNNTYSPETIRAKANYVEGLNDSQHAYRSGLDAITGHGAVQPSPKVVNHFKEVWAANNDPRIFEIDAALRRNDKAAATELVDGLTPQEKTQFKAQRRALMKLSQGQMP